MPEKRVSVVGACDQLVVPKEENGAMLPLAVRTYHSPRSCGEVR